MEEKIKLLIVDEEEYFCEALTWHLARKGYRVSCVASADEALPLIRAMGPAAILFDQDTAILCGRELLSQLRRYNINGRAIILNTDGFEFESPGALDAACLYKPASIPDLDAVIVKVAAL